MEDPVEYKKEGLEFVKFPKSYALYSVSVTSKKGLEYLHCVAKNTHEAIEKILAHTEEVKAIRAYMVCDVDQIYSTESTGTTARAV